MPSSKQFVRRALQQAFRPTIDVKRMGEEQVQCESCQVKFWINAVNLGLIHQVKRAVLCPKCQKRATEAALRQFIGGESE